MIFLRRFFTLLLAIGSITGSAGPSYAQAAPDPQPSIIRTATGLEIEWQAPAPRLALLPGGKTRVELPGFARVSEPGAPRLPFQSILVALPVGSAPSLEVQQVEETQVPLPAPVELAGRPQGVRLAPDGQVIGGAYAPATAAVPFDPAPVVFEALGSVRGVQLGRVYFYPARPAGAHLQVTTRIRAILHYNTKPLPGAVQLPGGSNPLESILRPAVVNPEHLQTGRAQIHAPSLQTASQTEGRALAAVEVDRVGITALSAADLTAAGIPAETVNPLALRLYRAGNEIPVEWEGNSDAHFEPGERLLFFAQPRFSRWTASDVYFLHQADTPGTAMPSRSAVPTSLPAGTIREEVTAEKNLIYTPECYCAPIPAGRDGDRWVWDRLQRPDRPSASYPVALTNVDPAQPATLTVWMIGYTDMDGTGADHRVEFTLNGVSLGSAEWNGKQAHQAVLNVPISVLQSGTNTLSLSLPGLSGAPVEGLWLDAFSIQYTRLNTVSQPSLIFRGSDSPHTYELSLVNVDGLRVYDVTNPDLPVRISPLDLGPGNSLTFGDPASGGVHTYWLGIEAGVINPVRIRQISPLQTGATTGADYILITPAEFAPALSDLIALRQSQGLKVAVEHVQAIYDAFGEGRPDPAAIRAFLAQAYATWDPRPVYVLLAGDGTADPRQYHAGSAKTFIPPYLAEVDPWAGETAADNRYVTLDGEDHLPDMLIGRLPVNNPAETQAVVKKIVEYETKPAPGAWNNSAVFVADDMDGGGDFPALSDVIAGSMDDSNPSVQRLYYTPPVVSPETVRQGLLDLWNQGTGLLMFTGHASIHQWAVEHFLHLNDVDNLTNAGRVPVVLEMTCFTGSFQLPGYASLDEALLRHPQGGAVAVWGPTGLGISTGHASLAEGFMQSLLQDQANLGRATLAGKINLVAESPAHLDLLDTFNLLGDPATALQRVPVAYPIYLPQINR